MARRNNTKIIVVIVVAFVILFGAFGTELLTGRVVGDIYRETDLDINTRAEINLAGRAGLITTSLNSDGMEYVIVHTQPAFLIVRVDPITNTWQLPSNGRADLIVSGVITQTILFSTLAIENIGGNNVYTWEWSLQNVAQGEHTIYVRFSGSWTESTAEATYVTNLVGKSHNIILDKDTVTDPNPLQLNFIGEDVTIEPYETTTLIWEYLYNGPLRAIVSEGEDITKQIIHIDTMLPESLLTTKFQFDFYGQYSGYHDITLTLTPQDGSNNDAKSVGTTVYVSVGGDLTRFPPSVDRCDITVDTVLHSTGVATSYDWNLFAESPSLQLSSSIISGNFVIKITTSPSDALTFVKATITNGIETLDYLAQKIGVSWEIVINTDNLADGQHTITIIGTDRTNAADYTLGTFNVAVRVGGPDPLFLALVVIIGVVIVGIVMILRRR